MLLFYIQKVYLFAAILKNNQSMSDTATKVKAIIVDKLGADEAEVTSVS